MASSIPTQLDIQESVNRLQRTFEGRYGNDSIVEDHRKIGAIRSDQDKIYIAFRGSVNSLWEILTCFDVRKVSMEEIGLSGRVHRGMFMAFSKIHQIVLTRLKEIGSEKPIVVEGYSRGAAIATLMGICLKLQLPNRSIIVLAYSPMKIFDREALCNDRSKIPPIYDFLCKEDLIPNWAPSCLGFFSIGRQYFFSAQSCLEYTNRVKNRTYLHLMPGWVGKIITWIVPARVWEAHMPETYTEGAPSIRITT